MQIKTVHRKDCIRDKLPQLNKEIKHLKVNYFSESHSHHSSICESVKETIFTNKRILGEVQLKRSKHEQIKSHIIFLSRVHFVEERERFIEINFFSSRTNFLVRRLFC